MKRVHTRLLIIAFVAFIAFIALSGCTQLGTSTQPGIGVGEQPPSGEPAPTGDDLPSGVQAGIPPSEPTGDQEEAVKIGLLLPLTGDASSYGLSVQKAIEMAKKELGSNAELVYEDTKCEGKEAVTAVNKLISVDGVQAIIGALCSGASIPAAAVANQNSVVMVSPASTSPELSNAGAYFFRTVPSDALQGAFGAQLVFDGGHQNLAVLYGNEEYGVGFEGVLNESFTNLGGTVAASEAFDRGSVDMRAQLTKIKEAGPSAIYIISNSPDSAAAALQQIQELGILATVYGSEGLKSPAVLEAAGAAAEGLIVSSVSSGTSDFIARHKAEYEADPGPFAAQGYDAFQAIHLALEAGARTGEEIRLELDETRFEGSSGTITFDEHGGVSGNYDVFVVQDNAFVPRKG